MLRSLIIVPMPRAIILPAKPQSIWHQRLRARLTQEVDACKRVEISQCLVQEAHSRARGGLWQASKVCWVSNSEI